MPGLDSVEERPARGFRDALSEEPARKLWDHALRVSKAPDRPRGQDSAESHADLVRQVRLHLDAHELSAWHRPSVADRAANGRAREFALGVALEAGHAIPDAWNGF